LHHGAVPDHEAAPVVGHHRQVGRPEQPDADRPGDHGVGDRDRCKRRHDHKTVERDIENSRLVSEEATESRVNQWGRYPDG